MHKDPIQSLFIGSKVIKLPSCHSTNRVVSDLLTEDKLTHGTVVITDHQTAGKGQRGNKWEAEPGQNLTFSAAIRPVFLPVNQQFELTVISSLAIVRTLLDLNLVDVSIKWPNDIFAADGKIAGILIENSVRSGQLEWAIIGIGLNVNQKQFATEGATSLFLQSGTSYMLEEVFEVLLGHLNAYYNWLRWGRISELRALYTRYLRWLDQPRTFRDTRTDHKFTGVITGVTDTGKLIVKQNDLEKIYDYKQIAFEQ